MGRAVPHRDAQGPNVVDGTAIERVLPPPPTITPSRPGCGARSPRRPPSPRPTEADHPRRRPIRTGCAACPMWSCPRTTRPPCDVLRTLDRGRLRRRHGNPRGRTLVDGFETPPPGDHGLRRVGLHFEVFDPRGPGPHRGGRPVHRPRAVSSERPPGVPNSASLTEKRELPWFAGKRGARRGGAADARRLRPARRRVLPVLSPACSTPSHCWRGTASLSSPPRWRAGAMWT